MGPIEALRKLWEFKMDESIVLSAFEISQIATLMDKGPPMTLRVKCGDGGPLTSTRNMHVELAGVDISHMVHTVKLELDRSNGCDVPHAVISVEPSEVEVDAAVLTYLQAKLPAPAEDGNEEETVG